MKKPLICFLIFGVAFLFISDFGFEGFLAGGFKYFDVWGIQFVRTFISDRMTGFMKVITQMGSAAVIVPASLIAMFYFGYIKGIVKDMFFIPFVTGAGGLLNEGFKLIFQRSRPDLTVLMEASGYSFPSGHSMAGMVFYGLMVYLIWEHSHRAITKYLFAGVGLIIILLVGISRIYLGVHYPSDVAGGFLAGLFWLAICANGYGRFTLERSSPRIRGLRL